MWIILHETFCKEMPKSSGTGGEIKLRNLLVRQGFEIEENKKFLRPEKNSYYEVDVYIEELHCAIEFDGKGYHSFKTRDKKRDEYLLEKYGLKIFRIGHFSEAVTEAILKFMNECGNDCKERSKKYKEELCED